MDLRQSPQYAKYMELTGWVVEKINGCYVYIRKFSPLPFSIIKIQRPQMIPFEKIAQLAKNYRAVAIYLEPLTTSHQSQITQYGYRLSKSPFLPSKTIQLNLTQPKEKILAQMKKDARYGIRKANKNDIRILRYKDIGKFHRSWRQTVSWQRWVPSLKSLQSLRKAFDKNALFCSPAPRDKKQSRGQIKPPAFGLGDALFLLAPGLGGTVILIAGGTAYYYYAFTSKEGRKKYAQYLLVWEAIKLAKKKGCKIFDFEGIYDKRFPQKSWKGFSHFKKSFGGKKIEYLGCFAKYRFPF